MLEMRVGRIIAMPGHWKRARLASSSIRRIVNFQNRPETLAGTGVPAE